MPTRRGSILGLDASGVSGWLQFASVPAPRTRADVDQSEADPMGQGLRIHSVEGTRFRRAIVRNAFAETLLQTSRPQIATSARIGQDWTGSVIREQTPLWKPYYTFRDLIGAFAARAALVIPVIAHQGYRGQLPSNQQPRLKKPDPWADTTRGYP